MTLSLVLLLELFARVVVRVPNPGSILLPAIAFAALSGGLRAGLLSALVHVAYTAVIFSGGDLSFVGDGLVRWLAVLAGAPAIALMCAAMRRAYLRSRERALTAQTAAEDSRAQLAAAATSLPIALGTLDAEGRVLASGGTVLPGLGVPPETPPGWSVFERFADQPELLRAFRTARDGSAESATVSAAGRVYDIRFVPTRLPSGELRIHGVGLDVTERESRERAARAESELARSIIEHVPLPIVLARADDGVMVEVNSALCQLLGLRHEEIVGHSGMELGLILSGGEVGDSAALLERVQREGQVTGVRLRVRARDGAARQVIASVSRVEVGGQARLLASVVDVTEHERVAEEVRSQRDRLARMDGQRESFLALIAHELRTPIAALDLVASALARADLGEAERSLLRSLREQARALVATTERLLEIGALESQAVRLDRTRCDLERVARRAVAQLALTDRAAVEREGAAVFAEVDEERLREALVNLLSNAAKYSPPDAPIRVRLSASDGHARIAVTDTGLGFGPDDVERLFQKYERLAAGRAADARGTGLGLYYVRLIAEAHGGSVRVTSDGPGRGATFVLEVAR